MRRIALFLNRLSRGRLTPNLITLISLLAHIPIAALIAQGYLIYAAIGLIIFGLFDTLDGELARLQKSASSIGMFLDSTTDRIKEILLYCGITVFLLHDSSTIIVAIIGALGASLCTSYVNAWGEVALTASSKESSHQVNKELRTGFLSFDVRMFLIVIGLLLDRLEIIIYVILVLAAQTLLQRIIYTVQQLKNVQA